MHFCFLPYNRNCGLGIYVNTSKWKIKWLCSIKGINIMMCLYFVQEIHRFKNEMASMETAVQERLGYLQRFKVSKMIKAKLCYDL